MSTNKETLNLISAMAHERNMPREAVVMAMEKAMVATYKRQHPEDKDSNIQGTLQETGEITLDRYSVVHADDERLENPMVQMRLKDAQELYPDITLGEVVVEPLEPIVMNRTLIRGFRQTLLEVMTRMEYEMNKSKWEENLGTLQYARVKNFSKGNVIFEFEGGILGQLDKSQQLFRDKMVIGQRIPLVVIGVNEQPRGPLVKLSRKSPLLLEALFEQEVPEIQDGLITIVSSLRSQSYRSLVAVDSKKESLSVVATCVGYQGSRISAVSDALGAERIELMKWSEDPVERISTALNSMNLVRIVQEGSTYWAGVKSAQDLDKVFHRYGPNAINLSQVMKIPLLRVELDSEIDMKIESSRQESILNLEVKLNLDAELAEVLVDEGLDTVSVLAHIEIQTLLEIGMDQEQAEALQERAMESLMKSWVRLDDMPEEIWMALETECDIHSWSDLAESTVFDVVGVAGLTEEQAGNIIMEARQPLLEKMAKENHKQNLEKHANPGKTVSIQKQKIK